LTSQNNFKKIRVKKPKMLLDLRKERWCQGLCNKLYKKYKNTSQILIVLFF
jgi:hypothetical protein